MPRHTIAVPGAASMTLDTDNPAEFVGQLSAHVQTATAAAVAPVQAQLDAARNALVDEAVRVRTLRLGAAAVNSAELTARFADYTPTQLSAFIADERAEAARAAPAPRTTSAGTAETPAAVLDADAPAPARLSAYDDAARFTGDMYGPATPAAPTPAAPAATGAAATGGAAAVVALFLFALASLFSPAHATAMPATAATVASAEVATPSPAVAALASADTDPADRDASHPVGTVAAIVSLAAFGMAYGGGASIFSRLRAFWGDCEVMPKLTPGGGYVANQVVQLGAQWGICRENYAAGTTAMFLIATTDAGIDFPKAALAFVSGAAVYWDVDGNPVGGVAGTGCITTVAAGNIPFGYCVEACDAGATDVRFRKTRTDQPTVAA